MSRTHHGKVALVTGSSESGGIGIAIARSLARRGCSLILTGSRQPEHVNKLKTELEAQYGIPTHYISADLSDLTSTKKLHEDVKYIYSDGVDILVNNAGKYIYSDGVDILINNAGKYIYSDGVDILINNAGKYISSDRVDVLANNAGKYIYSDGVAILVNNAGKYIYSDRVNILVNNAGKYIYSDGVEIPVNNAGKYIYSDKVDILINNAGEYIYCDREDILINNAVYTLVNNAGIFVAPNVVEEIPIDDFEKSLRINLTAGFYLTQLTLANMKQKAWGRVINISSIVGLAGTPLGAPYITSKHGMNGLTKVVALETLGSGVTCNAICPALSYTVMTEHIIRQFSIKMGQPKEETEKQLLEALNPSGKYIETDQIGELAAFLCSPAADQITGTAIPIDGGFGAK
ncbi:uncharacterized protein LOC144438051 [Glandiceps talaboti]